MSRILVTGGMGFIGQHAVKALEDAGHELILVTRKQVEAKTSGAFLYGDLLKEGEPERIVKEARAEYLLHLAWETEHGHFWNAESNYLWKKQSINLVTSFWEQGGHRAVCAGSCAEYDWSAKTSESPLDEFHSPLLPGTVYGQCKVDCFRALESLSDQTHSLAWGRVFLLYGKGETGTRFVPSIITSLLDDCEAKMSSGSQVRDFLDSRDVGRAFAALTMSDVLGAVNISSGTGVQLIDVAKMIGELIGKSELLKPGAFPDRAGEPLNLVGVNQRLTDEVGFVPEYSLKSGLSDVIKYWQKMITQNE
ncbi:NAD(P)-dependent oxidoreductase [uncultured Kiloniella sp.]|uniref:NAD-dependent epimerase/dehydratase family protein n=1 Tax=uncultured Kiloniella sp. TaxID=1133091 RepID=UPI002639B1F5|nr:NAD(P)-dependent oxidoreductase [uncultured Kiloniella sp.]